MTGSWIVLTAAMVLLAGYSEVSREYALHLSESRQFRDASEACLELNLDTGRGVMTLAYTGDRPPYLVRIVMSRRIETSSLRTPGTFA
mgnify:FL=1